MESLIFASVYSQFCLLYGILLILLLLTLLYKSPSKVVSTEGILLYHVVHCGCHKKNSVYNKQLKRPLTIYKDQNTLKHINSSNLLLACLRLFYLIA